MKKVVLLGSGHVATHLGHAIRQAGYVPIQVYSRTLAHAERLAVLLDAEATADPGTVRQDADFYLIAVKDDAIAAIAAALGAVSGIVLHTSGSTDLRVLSGAGKGQGVIYPIQTLTRDVPVDFTKIPLAIEYSDDATGSAVKTFAGQLSSYIYEYNSRQRLSLHVGAVFCCNFSNYLYTIAQDYLESQKVDFNLLRPLIEETARKVQHRLPSEVQTGPAARRDTLVLEKHLELLDDFSQWKEIYRILSACIMQRSDTGR